MVEITTEICCDFRRMLQAFDDCAKWPDAVIEQAMIEADARTGSSGWGRFDLANDRNLKKRGMFYLTAHLLVSMYGSEGAIDPTAIAPEARLNVSAKSVGDESIQYRITAMESTADDYLSTTMYGVWFVALRRQASTLPFCI